METITLSEGLAWLISGGGAGFFAFWIIGKVKWLEQLRPDYKRYASLGIAAGVAILAWLVSMGLGYVPTPETWRAWLESIFSVAFAAVAVSQVTHGATVLRRRANGG